MDIDIELYRGKQPEYYGEYQLDAVLRRAAVRRFGNRAKHAKIQIELAPPRDLDPYSGPPEVRNLAAGGHCKIRLLRGGQLVLEEELRVAELLGPVLADELRDLEPAESQWGFILRRRILPTLLVITQNLLDSLADSLGRIDIDSERPAPEAKGAVDVDLTLRRHRPFTLKPIANAAAERVSPEDLGLDAGQLGRLNVLISAEMRNELLHEMPLSERMEEGGFLLGRVHEAGPDTHLVEVTHVTPAHHSGAGPVHFTFTGESFLAAAQVIGERGLGEELVGWYHTHPFGIGLDMGLSSIDVDLHLATFQRPWQVAALINIGESKRVLRFYGRGKDAKNGIDETGSKDRLIEYGQWIADDSGRYRAADDAVGGG
jgi:proteasome lid subunit RPN8/RPN11